jgi:hypothetical protein
MTAPSVTEATANDLRIFNQIWKRLTVLAGYFKDDTFPFGLFGQIATTAPTKIYVATTGNDANPGTDPLLPCATPAGALSKIPGKYVRHFVDIEIAAGNYPGFDMTGFNVDPIDNTMPCGIRMFGTLVDATLASGSASGTWTGTATGSNTTVVWSTLTDSTQNWPVNALAGLLVEIVSGTNVLSIIPIQSNTATTITVMTQFAFASVGGTYRIRDWGTQITSPVPLAGSIGAFNATPVASTNTVCININNNVVSPNVIQLRFENLKINPTTPAVFGIRCTNAFATFQRIWFGGSISGNQLLVTGPATVTSCVSTATGTGTIAFSMQDGAHNISSTYFKGNASNFATAISLTRSQPSNCGSNYCSNFYSPVLINSSSLVGVSGLHCTGYAAGGIRMRLDGGSPLVGTSIGSAITGTSVRMENGLYGIDAGQGNMVNVGNVICVNQNFGIGAAYGARISVGPSSSFYQYCCR